MQYQMEFQNWGGVFAVPIDLVEKHLKLAGAVQLKVILWALHQNHSQFTAEAIAEALRLSVGDVHDALQYWIDAGLLRSEQSDCKATPSQAAAAKEIAPAKPLRRPLKPNSQTITERVDQSAEISFLMKQAELILGKTLSPALSSTILAAHDDYGLPVNVIIMLLEYVKSIQKTGTNYIDAVAKAWAEENITTHDAVEQKLKQLNELSRAWRKLEVTFGIDHRSPSTREEEYTERWLFQWGFSLAMIREAYDRCVDRTGKLSLSYINKILERWHRNGITTPEQAKAETDARSAKKTAKDTQTPTYDLSAFEEMDIIADSVLHSTQSK